MTRKTTSKVSMAEPEKILMSVRNLKKHYSIGSSFFKSNNEYVKAVDGIDLDLYSGKTLGLVGSAHVANLKMHCWITRSPARSGLKPTI